MPEALLKMESKDVPKNLQCPICHELFRSASVVSCCGTSFCDACIRDKLDETNFVCPSCGQQTSSEAVVPNKTLREVRRVIPLPAGLRHPRPSLTPFLVVCE